MKKYLFKIEISGNGENLSEAWDEALNSLVLDPEIPHRNYQELCFDCGYLIEDCQCDKDNFEDFGDKADRLYEEKRDKKLCQ